MQITSLIKIKASLSKFDGKNKFGGKDWVTLKRSWI